MNLIQRVMTVGSLALVLGACSKDTADGERNPLLSYVPADTPYVMANLEPVPAEVTDAWLTRMQPALDQLQSEIAHLRAELLASDGDEPAARVMAAILTELDGNLSRAGLERLGLSLEAPNVAYGHGMLPMVRMGLGDVDNFQDMIMRVQTASGQAFEAYELGGDAYWKVDGGGQGALYAAVVDQHLVLGMAPVAFENDYLPILLGQSKPATSLADNGNLGALQREQGYAPYAVGFVDLRLALDQFLKPDSTTATMINAVGEFDITQIDPACAREARLATTFVPRLLMGSTELTSNAVAVQYQLETNSLLGKQLADLVSDVPAASSDDRALASMALGIRFGALREFLLKQSGLLLDHPFECPQLQGLNRQVQNMHTQISQPMPPFLGNLRGMRASLMDIDLQDPQPANARGMLSLEMDKPQMVIGMASMLVPGFEELNIEPGAEPVLVPQELLSVVTPEFEVYAMMTSDAIGLSLGKDQKAALPDYLEQDQDNGGTFLSFDYDMARGLDLQQQAATTTVDTDNPELSWQELARVYQSSLGRNRLEMRFTDDGLVIDQRQSFP